MEHTRLFKQTTGQSEHPAVQQQNISPHTNQRALFGIVR